MTMAEQLYEVGSKLPPPALAELLDFAEFLRQKCAPPYPAQRISLAELRGGVGRFPYFCRIAPVHPEKNAP